MLIGSYLDTPNLDDSEDEIDTDSSGDENDNGVKKIIRIKWSKHKGKLYYDVKSENNIWNLVKTSNSFNRNFAITFGWSAPKYIFD